MLTILLFGLSDILPVAGGDEARWPTFFQPALEAELGEPVRMELRRFSWDARDPRDYIQRCLDETAPDVVSLSLTVLPFAATRVQTQVDQRFGRTVGRLAQAVERRTTNPGQAGKPSLVSTVARRVARRTVGAATLYTREEIDRSIENAFRLLAQQEQLAVVIRPEPPPSPFLARQNPSYGTIQHSFNEYWEERARQHHFTWAPAAARDAEHWLQDGVHPSEEGHRSRAMVLLPAFLEAIRALPAR